MTLLLTYFSLSNLQGWTTDARGSIASQWWVTWENVHNYANMKRRKYNMGLKCTIGQERNCADRWESEVIVSSWVLFKTRSSITWFIERTMYSWILTVLLLPVIYTRTHWYQGRREIYMLCTLTVHMYLTIVIFVIPHTYVFFCLL